MTKMHRPKKFSVTELVARVCITALLVASVLCGAETQVAPTALTKNERIARAEERELARLHAEDAKESTPAPVVSPTPVPLVDGSDKLIALHDTAPLWITPDKKQVVMVGRVVFREGMLELFACRRRSKEHESIVAIDVTPHLIHAALLAIGADAGKPASFEPKFTPATGDAIAVKLIWKDDDGKQQTANASDWITPRNTTIIDAPRHENDTAKPVSKSPPIEWVFAGSLNYTDDDGRIHYVADETGELIGLSNFAGAILDVPIESSSSNESLLFSPKTDAIPPLGTEITITLEKLKRSDAQ
ncbi:MAG: YdjY domain-containing protein [Thermoguttaceae bacterium]